MLMTEHNGFGDFTVMDDATGERVLAIWVDDEGLEMRVISQRQMLGTDWSTELVKVTKVRVDYVNKVIHVNEPPVPVIAVKQTPACDSCRQDETCRRIHYCAAYRCGFGEVSKP